MYRKLGNFLIISLLVFAGIFTLSEVVSANDDDFDLSSVSEKQMPKEVKEVLEILNSDNKVGNETDGFITGGDPNTSIYTQNIKSLNTLSEGSKDSIQPTAIIGQTKSNNKNFGYSNSGNSVINITVGNPGFWRSLYQNKYDGWGYTSQFNGSYTPSRAVSTVTASATGVIPNISTSGSSWGLFNTTREIGKDTTTNWNRKSYAMAYTDDVRIQNLSNLTVKFEVKSELHYSAVGSRTTYNSVRFW